MESSRTATLSSQTSIFTTSNKRVSHKLKENRMCLLPRHQYRTEKSCADQKFGGYDKALKAWFTRICHSCYKRIRLSFKITLVSLTSMLFTNYPSLCLKAVMQSSKSLRWPTCQLSARIYQFMASSNREGSRTSQRQRKMYHEVYPACHLSSHASTKKTLALTRPRK